jgi:hypothetical protein
MKKAFIFWDDSNIFISAKTVASAREGPDAYDQIRTDFQKLLDLAQDNRELESAIAVGSIPPPLRHVWNRLEQLGVKVEIYERGSYSDKEQAVDQALQIHMLRTAFDYIGDPGVVVMLTGDGKGFLDGVGFHADLERMHCRGWEIEVLAWERTCNPRMKKWAQAFGLFIPLELFYESVTFTEDQGVVLRRSAPLDVTHRPRKTQT